MTNVPNQLAAWRFGPDWPGQRCGARRKYDGKPCRQAAMPNGRCRMHGGKSTGPRTQEGKDRVRRANTKYGMYAGPDHPDFPSGLPGPKWRNPKVTEARRMWRGTSRKTGRKVRLF